MMLHACTGAHGWWAQDLCTHSAWLTSLLCWCPPVSAHHEMMHVSARLIEYCSTTPFHTWTPEPLRNPAGQFGWAPSAQLLDMMPVCDEVELPHALGYV